MNKTKLISGFIIALTLLSGCTGTTVTNNNPTNNNGSTSTNNNNSTNNQPSNNGSNSNIKVQATVSTLISNISSDVSLKTINDLGLDGKGNLYILDANRFYKIKLSDNTIKYIHPASKIDVFTLPVFQFESTSFLIDDKNLDTIGLTVPLNDNALLKISLSPDGEEARNQINLSYNKTSFGAFTGIVKDSKGNTFICDRNAKIYKFSQNNLSVFVGGGDNGITTGKNDGNGKNATFLSPEKIAIDKNDNIYVADTGNHSIRKITPDANVTTIAGDGLSGDIDSGNNQKAKFNSPKGVAVDNEGNVYVADTGNNKIKRITPDGTVTTIAGSGSLGNNDGINNSASFYEPSVIVSDGNNTLYVGDFINKKVRKIEVR
ncbi:MAG: SMP-30/gluconolactonase/LRE family protein [Candidatus Sericytochromatia bacterium]|nr:SMP-30/gluconolactonase/LRE family protein [Candidatus Sericytochromatia bacterium]